MTHGPELWIGEIPCFGISYGPYGMGPVASGRGQCDIDGVSEVFRVSTCQTCQTMGSPDTTKILTNRKVLTN